MKTLLPKCALTFALAFLSFGLSFGQGTINKTSADEVAREEARIRSELKDLSGDVSKLEAPLTRASVETEIADAAWTLDRAWARSLLADAYRLTLPADDEKQTSRTSNAVDRARNSIRTRVLVVASRDKEFANQLTEEGAKKLSARDRSSIYSGLARTAIADDNIALAADTITKSFAGDPVNGAAITVINELALKDRELADSLIVQYLQALRAVPLSNGDFSLPAVSLGLSQLMFPNSIFPDPNKRIPSPGPAAMRAYVAYVIDAMSRMEASAPGSLKGARSFLLSAWLPLKEFAPELTGSFMELEKLSRYPDQNPALPTQTYEERDRERYAARSKAALDSGQPDPAAIASLISHGDFEKARGLIDRLPDGEEKKRLAETAATEEAVSLAHKGDVFGAAKVAERLVKASSMLRVFPLIIHSCLDSKDQACAKTFVYQAVKQLRNADTTPPTAPAGMPASALFSQREVDPVVYDLGALALSLGQTERELSMDVLDEMVLAANKTTIDPQFGRLGFNVNVFTRLAAVDESRVRAAALNLTMPLQRLSALAAIFRYEAEQLKKKASPPPSTKSTDLNSQ